MKTKSICMILPAVALFGLSQASAATVPAGSTLVVRTLQSIMSTDVVNTRFPVELMNNVSAGSKVVLHAGTRMSARVVTSRRTFHSNQRLSVDLTQAMVGGRAVPIHTTGAVQLDNTRFKTRNDVPVSRAGYSVPAGRVIRFHLGRPMQI